MIQPLYRNVDEKEFLSYVQCEFWLKTKPESLDELVDKYIHTELGTYFDFGVGYNHSTEESGIFIGNEEVWYLWVPENKILYVEFITDEEVQLATELDEPVEVYISAEQFLCEWEFEEGGYLPDDVVQHNQELIKEMHETLFNKTKE